MYIVVEGVQGSGKTTQAKKLVEYLVQNYPNRNIVFTREPGGNEISDAIRKLVQATKFSEKMDPVTDAYLYAASRAEGLRKVVLPALATGAIVISDRSFISSLAIQGHAQGLGLEKILEINKIAIESAIPDLVVYVSIEPKIAYSRLCDQEGDKFESESLDFAKKCHEGYELASQLPLLVGKWVDIDGNGSIDEVFKNLTDKVLPKIK